MVSLSIIVLMAVFVLIAVRKVGRYRFQMWQVMLGGALVVLVFSEITPPEAIAAINVDVMVFLFCMFVIGEAMEESGYLEHISYKIFRRAKTTDQLVLLILFGVGAISALLMNDMLAIVGTPVMLMMAKRHNMSPKLLLLTLCFAVTIGGVLTPIGNPQNLLVAMEGGFANPFFTFLRYLFVPTIICAFAAYLLLRVFYKKDFHAEPLTHGDPAIKDPALARLSKASLYILLALIFVKIGVVVLGINFDFRLTYIAAASAAPILLLSPRRGEVLRDIDWHTLIFFASMFVLMAAVWSSGFFQSLVGDFHLNMTSIAVILIVSVLLSQLISNVPLVALFIPMLLAAGAGEKGMVALAAGSTIAGNLFILGAASNVIIIQNAERRTGDTLTFWEFARVGMPLTVICILVYWLFFLL